MLIRLLYVGSAPIDRMPTRLRLIDYYNVRKKFVLRIGALPKISKLDNTDSQGFFAWQI